MTDLEPSHRLADLLERVVDGKLEAIDALKQADKWADMPWERRDVNLAMHTLMRFHIDTDIRENNSDYDEDMKHSLLLHVSNLRAN